MHVSNSSESKINYFGFKQHSTTFTSKAIKLNVHALLCICSLLKGPLCSHDLIVVVD